MRTKEEIIDLVKEIDNGKGKVKDKNDIEYLNDVKIALQWVLKKISAGQGTSNMEEEMRYVADHSATDELEEDEIKTLMDFMDKEFDGYFKITSTIRLETAACNVSDTWDWISERLTTKQFLSDNYLKLK